MSTKTSISASISTLVVKKLRLNKVFADYTLTSNDSFLAVDCSSGLVTIKLPSAALPKVDYPIISPQRYEIKKVDSTQNYVKILTANLETIDYNNSYTLYSPCESIGLISDGYNWLIH